MEMLIDKNRKQLIGILMAMLFLLSACSVNKKLAVQTDEKLIESINQLINCLNSKDQDCVLGLYSPQFDSFSPITNINSVEDLVDVTVSSMAKNNYFVVSEITELEMGAQLAYVRLNWKMVEQNADESYNLVIDEKRLDIWRLEGNNWKLYRSLFYKEISY